MNCIRKSTRLAVIATPAQYRSQFFSSKRTLSKSRKLLVASGSVICAGGLGLNWYESDVEAKHIAVAIKRISIATNVGIKVALDYKKTHSKDYNSEQEQLEAKKKCHKRCAERVLEGLQRLGGIYVKLGQHVSAMSYILPVEWTSTLAVLQDRCDPSSPKDIQQLFLSDYGQSLEDVFEEFDWVPLGVASLAQVHKGRLKNSENQNPEWVAVKFQHPRLDEFCLIDLQTVTFIINSIKKMFPDFGFEWILQEMKESLPQEMDFVQEAQNSVQVVKNFEYEQRRGQTPLVVPQVMWAKRRILCMEFIEGSRVDDQAYMEKHNIDPSQVSTEITNIFSKMMFIDGFVHCDPHPGNILIRPSKNPKSQFNFDVVLLDHGTYRTLTDELRTDYAHLWTSLIQGDEDGIRKYSLRVGCRPESHRLFASLLTGREWSTITSAALSTERTATEMNRVSGRAKGFVSRIYDILGTLPRIVLLLLKTSDLLRSLDEALRRSGDKYMTYALMGKFCAKAVWIDARSNLLYHLKRSTSFLNSLKLMGNIFAAWWEYQYLEIGLRVYRLQSNIRAKLQ